MNTSSINKPGYKNSNNQLTVLVSTLAYSSLKVANSKLWELNFNPVKQLLAVSYFFIKNNSFIDV